MGMTRDQGEEDSIVYRDGGITRRVRGVIIDEDSNFITLQRFDGTIQIALSVIEKIERRSGC